MAHSNILTSDRLLFEPWDAKDEETKDFVYQNLNRDLNVASTASIDVLSPASRSSMGESWETMIAGNYFKTIICLKPDNWDEVSAKPATQKFRGTPIGFMAIFGIPPSQMHNRSGTMAISLATEHQGKGYGSEALRWLVDWAFQFGNLHSLRLETKGGNLKALRSYEKVGFVKDGCMREAWFWNGKYDDIVLMSILRHEWEVKRKA